jgi:lysophospholipase L1-like esterase
MRHGQHEAGTGRHGTTSPRRWVPKLVAVGALASTVFAVAPAVTASAAATTYVSLGDSYVAGPLIPTQVSPLGCLKSDKNYPSDTAAALGLSLTDVSCSGATTGSMYTSQNVTPGPANPPQLSVITSSTQVVSISIGGNDIGFVSILENCAALTPWGPTKVGQNCKSYYDPNGQNSLLAQITALGPKVGAILQAVHTQAPAAKVFVVGYPAILPPSGACWPSLPLETGDANYLRATELELDGMLKAQAVANGATYVNTYTPSIHHNACTAESVRWVEPLIPDSSAAPVHPNAVGEAAMAGILEAAMRAAGIS